MKRIFVIFTAVASCCASQSHGTGSPWRGLPQKILDLRKSVVHIIADGKESGTGFVVSANGYIITATHVVESREPYFSRGQIQVDYTKSLDVELSDGEHLPAKAIPNTGQYGGEDTKRNLKHAKWPPRIRVLGCGVAGIHLDREWTMNPSDSHRLD
jgi:hypothetical protein